MTTGWNLVADASSSAHHRLESAGGRAARVSTSVFDRFPNFARDAVLSLGEHSFQLLIAHGVSTGIDRAAAGLGVLRPRWNQPPAEHGELPLAVHQPHGGH